MRAGHDSSLLPPPCRVSEARWRGGEFSFFLLPESSCSSLLSAALTVQSCSLTPGSTMERGELLAVCVLWLSCSVCVVTAIQRADLFSYGTLSGDLVLAEGDDETSRVLSLPRSLYFYDSLFSQLYVSNSCSLFCMHVAV